MEYCEEVKFRAPLGTTRAYQAAARSTELTMSEWVRGVLSQDLRKRGISIEPEIQDVPRRFMRFGDEHAA